MKKKQTPNHECPVCSTPAQAPTTVETCLRLPEKGSMTLDTLLDNCIKPDVIHAFHTHDEGIDPCIDCGYNEVSHDPGTFIEMKPVGEKRWVEIHECPNCRTQYELLTI